MLARGLPPGLGSHVHWDRKLDALIAQALMSIQAIKAVEIGTGREDQVVFRMAVLLAHLHVHAGVEVEVGLEAAPVLFRFKKVEDNAP